MSNIQTKFGEQDFMEADTLKTWELNITQTLQTQLKQDSACYLS